MEFTLDFFGIFVFVVYFFVPILLFLALAIALLGQCVGKIEGWPRFDAFYWSFITATTIGYGDLRPKEKLSRILSILIGFTGIIFTGILVAIAIYSATFVLQKHYDSEALRQRIYKME